MTTYYARVDYSYSGDSKFTIPFSYIKKEHIVVLVNDVKTTNYTYITSSQIEVKDGLQAGDVVSIRRTTPIKDKLVSFTDLNILNGETQNLAQEQVFNAVQEMYDDNTQFKIDTENNILQNRTEIDAQIEANNQELLNIQSSFESKVNTTIETVKEAAEKINNLKQAVTTATSAATTATNAANTASAAAESATSAAATATAKAEEVSQALATKEDKANKGVANGYASLDANGKVPVAQIPNTSIELCDIGMALYVDETKGLRRYLNGQIVDINTNTQAFLNRLLEIKNTNPDYFTTEENWQAEATLNIDGCVYKFVLNYSGETVVSVRLPKYPDYVEINAGGTLPVVGNGMTLGLTNGIYYGSFNVDNASGTTYISDNAYGKNISNPSMAAIPVTTGLLGVTTDPTKSGIQTTLKQTKLKMRYFIQIATGAETENNIINDIELNNPYSLFDSKYSDHALNNLSWLKSEGQWNAKSVYPTAYDKLLKVQNGTETVEGLSVKLSTETYTDYDFVLNTTDETFRLPLKNNTADDGKSVLTLYYYVGETVQNANLIDAGRIGELVANCITRNDCKAYITETYVNGTSGYIIWSNGYCEQWGFIPSQTRNDNFQVTLLKEFVDTNYNLITNKWIVTNITNAIAAYSFYTNNKTTSGFTTAIDPNVACSWRACGYIN